MWYVYFCIIRCYSITRFHLHPLLYHTFLSPYTSSHRSIQKWHLPNIIMMCCSYVHFYGYHYISWIIWFLILSLQDDGHVDVLDDLFSLRFNLHIRTMYLEQEMYSADGKMYETMLVQKNTTEVDFMWILRPDSFRVIGLSESQMQASIIILTNESGTSKVQIFYVATVKWESTDDSVFVLLDLEDDIFASIDFSNTSSFPFKSVHSTSSQFPMYVTKSPCGPIYKTVVPHISNF